MTRARIGSNRTRPGSLAPALLAGLTGLTGLTGLAVTGAPPAQALDAEPDLHWRPPRVVQLRLDRLHLDAAARRPGVRDDTRSKVRAGAAGVREGSFVSFRRAVFRIAGGAPWYVSTWNVYGRRHPVTALTEDQFYDLEPYPVDGTFVRTQQDGRFYRFVGGAPLYVSTWAAFGNRPQPAVLVDQVTLDRTHLDRGSGFPYENLYPCPIDVVYDEANDRDVLDARIFLRAGQTGKIYKLLGGSVRYVPSWTPYGGPKPTVTVDQVTLDRAGETAGPYRFIRRYPIDNWLVQLPTRQLFVTAGGAPVYLATPALAHGWFGNTVAAKVDQDVLDSLRPVPEDGTVLFGLPAGLNPSENAVDLTANLYQVEAGVPVLQDTGTFIDLLLDTDFETTVFVDQLAIDRAGSGGVYDHLLAAPT